MPSVEPIESAVSEAIPEMPVEKKAKIDDGKSAISSNVTSEASTQKTSEVNHEAPAAATTDVGTDAPSDSEAVRPVAVSDCSSLAVADKVVRQTLRFAKLSERAKAPTRGSVDAAGYDLYAAEEKVIEPGKRACVKTDIQIEVPSGTYGRVAPRSGLAAKHGIDVGAGVVDKDYRGNVMVLLFNFGDAAFSVSPGDRIAQLVLEKICMAELEELPTLDETDRGDGGFGSTGKA